MSAPALPLPRQRPRTRDDQPSLHAIAVAFVVTGRTGRERSILLVQRCPFRCDGGVHAHTAPAGFEVGRRRAPCGGGSYVLHAVRGGRG